MFSGSDQPSIERRLNSGPPSVAAGGAAKAKFLANLLLVSWVRSFIRPENMIAMAAVPLYICCCTFGWSKVVTCGSM